MQKFGVKKMQIRQTILAAAALIMANSADAGVLHGGTFSVTYDNPNNLLEGLTIGPGGLTEYYVANFFPKAVADTYSTIADIITVPTNTYPAPPTLEYVVNPADLTGTGIPTGAGGRANKPTTLTWDASQDALVDSSAFIANGQIGLNGVVMTRGSFTGTLTSGDYTFEYNASRNDGVNSGWTLWNNTSFRTSTYDARNISVTTNGDELLMTGELWWSPNMTAFLFGGDGSNSAGKAATFTLVSPAVVPVPAAVWLFGSGLLSLLAGARRKSVQAALSA
ncbi:hypothetical protein [Methylocaldum gracile]|jgi:hypothetical protein|uniref:hypothetical protein n=1 Tax=unclassified Methylocaldum TaxID=2622260 RepID=UPI00105E6CCE